MEKPVWHEIMKSLYLIVRKMVSTEGFPFTQSNDGEVKPGNQNELE